LFLFFFYEQDFVALELALFELVALAEQFLAFALQQDFLLVADFVLLLPLVISLALTFLTDEVVFESFVVFLLPNILTPFL